MYSPDIIQRFWARVEKCFHGNECQHCCWAWQGHCLASGYGTVSWKLKGAPGKWDYAHRMAWSINHGAIPQGMVIMHTCDYPSCVNPAHLQLGTPQDNARDAQAKGRLMAGDRHYLRLDPEKIGYGEEAPNSSLTTEIVITIRQLYAEGWPQKQIADYLKIGTSAVFKIVHRQRWPHIPGGDEGPAKTVCPKCGKEIARIYGNDIRHIEACGKS